MLGDETVVTKDLGGGGGAASPAVGNEVLSATFSSIYKNAAWGLGSGRGSAPENTVEYRRFLEIFIALNDVRSIVDIGCGDWQSSRYVNFGRATYLGVDVVEEVIQANVRNFARENVAFAMAPPSLESIPPADLLIMKDVLQHLSDAEVINYRRKVIPKFRFCLITNSWHTKRYPKNVDIVSGEFRSLDLLQNPYGFRGTYVLETLHQWETARTLLVTNAAQPA